MQSVEAILNKYYQKAGKTDPSLEEKEKSQDQKEYETKWAKAKQEVIKKTPLEWFDITIAEWLASGKEGTKTVSDLKYYKFLQQKEGVWKIDKLGKIQGEFVLTVQIDEGNPPKSCVMLTSYRLNKIFRYPDWDSLKAMSETAKSGRPKL